MSLSKDEIRSIAVEVAQIMSQSAVQTTGQVTAEEVAQLAGQSQQTDQTSTSTTNRAVDQQIEDVHADAALKSNVALDQSIETIRKNFGGDLSNAYGWAFLNQAFRHTEEQHGIRMINQTNTSANERMITVKTLDLQDSATTIPK